MAEIIFIAEHTEEIILPQDNNTDCEYTMTVMIKHFL